MSESQDGAWHVRHRPLSQSLAIFARKSYSGMGASVSGLRRELVDAGIHGA